MLARVGLHAIPSPLDAEDSPVALPCGGGVASDRFSKRKVHIGSGGGPKVVRLPGIGTVEVDVNRYVEKALKNQNPDHGRDRTADADKRKG